MTLKLFSFLLQTFLFPILSNLYQTKASCMQKFSNDVKSFKIFSLVPDSNCGPVLLFSIIKLGVNHIGLVLFVTWSFIVPSVSLEHLACVLAGHPDKVKLSGLMHLPDSGDHQHVHDVVRVEEGVKLAREPSSNTIHDQ